jgi:PadR family transcriptional regulator PadR
MRITHQTRLVLQALLDARDQESYGFDLVRTTGVKAGTLYPVLERLSAEGWLSSRWENINEADEGRRRRRYYRLTSLGERCARAAIGQDRDPLRALMPGFAS